MIEEVSERLREQYEQIAQDIESQGLGYALWPGGYITPDTDDEELNEAITKAVEGIRKIEDIIEPYKF